MTKVTMSYTVNSILVNSIRLVYNSMLSGTDQAQYCVLVPRLEIIKTKDQWFKVWNSKAKFLSQKSRACIMHT
jgi:hypothetical protein